jgi:hypothetical protein
MDKEFTDEMMEFHLKLNVKMDTAKQQQEDTLAEKRREIQRENELFK